ncbi:MAG: type II toxin-antitoxin system RelE/ParE family toxin [Bacteroidetes bacterium]|nr:type II toxin-antitoxin system RelE/ParE family toxin [Bacteroidota bacterium]
MEILFSSTKLQKLANDHKKCQKELGAVGAKRFNMRMLDLRDAISLEDLRNAPGRFHELKGNRKGQWSCDLDHPYRLIFEPVEKPIPTVESGAYIWAQIKKIKIIEIVDYHD